MPERQTYGVIPVKGSVQAMHLDPIISERARSLFCLTLHYSAAGSPLSGHHGFVEEGEPPATKSNSGVEALRTPADLHSLFSTMISGPSLLLTYDMLNVPERFPEHGKYTGPGRWPFRVVELDFAAGAATKVGGRNTKVITYRVLDLPGPGAGDCTFTLWIDAETMLPLKRLVAAAGNEGEPGAITEICNVSLNPKIDAGVFLMPK